MPSSTALTLAIEEPLPEHRNGIITGYLVRVTRASNGSVQEQSSTHAAVTVSSLTPYTQYFVDVAARTVNGTGPFSERYEVTTLEAGEEKKDCNFHVIHETSVSIQGAGNLWGVSFGFILSK